MTGPEPQDAVCARCRRPLRPAAPKGASHSRRLPGMVVAVRHWPEGPICSGCYATACETSGTCPGCTSHRLLPGRDRQGRAVCTDCAGGIGDFTCTRCGTEGWRHLKGVCGRCVLRERLLAALEDDTGHLHPDLAPLLDHLCAMPRPRTGLLWLTKPHTLRLLHTLATSEVPLTHDGLAQLQPYRAVSYLRQQLIAAGVLPDRDPTLSRIQEWTTTFLATIPDPDAQALLRQYVHWHLLRRLTDDAARHRLHPYRDQNHRYQLRQAAAFLRDLSNHATAVNTLTQADLDTWATTVNPAPRDAVLSFLRWAIRTGHAPRLDLPISHHAPGTPITHGERLAWLRRAATDTTLTTRDRVVLALLLLYAQPIPRIARLTITAIGHDTLGRVTLHLGDPPAPVPDPFDQILLTYLQHARHATAGNPHSPWLFPGRHATLPIHPTTLRLRLHTLGLQPQAARAATLHQLSAQAPPAILATMLGYQPATTERHAHHAGATWSRYAALRTAGPP